MAVLMILLLGVGAENIGKFLVQKQLAIEIPLLQYILTYPLSSRRM